MLHHREHQSDSEWHAKARILASALSVDLKRELFRIEQLRNQPPWPRKAVYDAVYLPRTSELADSVEHRGIADVNLLREPLWEEFGATQIRIVFEFLEDVVVVLSKH